MRLISLSIMICILSFSLAGCGEEKTEEYLIWHPNRLFKDVAQCESARNQEGERGVYCKMVLKTTSSFMAVVTQQQLSPEEFGLKVLKKQMEYADLKQAITREKSALPSSQIVSKKDKNAKSEPGKQLADLESKYRLIGHEIGMMLAAIGLIPPE